ncbi:relaxase domain-containing protein [Nonomuraea rubra]|uniref:relaxase domain-containing protein n=1 Tax=Nonomuraea rubra TaxID=46180 RepID=UPI00340A25CE
MLLNPQSSRRSRNADARVRAPEGRGLLGPACLLPRRDLLLAKAAEQQHHHPDAALVLRARAELVWEAVMAGSAAMLDHYQDVCGVSRAGKHGPKAPGRSTGRWVDAPRRVVAAFRQHTSRNGDPQLHVHRPVLNRVPCDIDGKMACPGQPGHPRRPPGRRRTGRAGEVGDTDDLATGSPPSPHRRSRATRQRHRTRAGERGQSRARLSTCRSATSCRRRSPTSSRPRRSSPAMR